MHQGHRSRIHERDMVLERSRRSCPRDTAESLCRNLTTCHARDEQLEPGALKSAWRSLTFVLSCECTVTDGTTSLSSPSVCDTGETPRRCLDYSKKTRVAPLAFSSVESSKQGIR